MFCNACGSEISLAAAVCPSCGRVIAPADAITLTHSGSATRLAQSDSWARPAEALATPTVASGAASIFAGDLDQPGFPRDMPRRVALLTGIVMTADLLLPWVSVNGEGFAPVRMGAPALALVLALAAVIAPPLVPRLRRSAMTRALPFGVGALLLGVGLALWFFAVALAPALTSAFIARLVSAGASDFTIALNGQQSSLLQVTPAVGLYLFLLGACVLLVAGYRALNSAGES